MYSPVLSEVMVKTLYRLKQTQRKPMTVMVEELLLRALADLDKELVCEVCVKANNNDCKSCYFSRNSIVRILMK